MLWGKNACRRACKNKYICTYLYVQVYIHTDRQKEMKKIEHRVCCLFEESGIHRSEWHRNFLIGTPEIVVVNLETLIESPHVRCNAMRCNDIQKYPIPFHFCHVHMCGWVCAYM